MTTESTNEPARSEKDRVDDESIRESQKVAWHGSDKCEVCPPADAPIRIGDVYELVSVILKYAPFDHIQPTDECIVEVTSQRGWPVFFALVEEIDTFSGSYDEARSS